MNNTVIEDAVLKNIDASELRRSRSYESCTFLNCDLSYADLSGQMFIDCIFTDCNLSLIKVGNTGLQGCVFHDCKLTGVNFTSCNDFSLSLSFNRSILDYSVFHKKKLKSTQFVDCSLEEADFSEADLSKAGFHGCNLGRTIFNRTVLNGADFTTAVNFAIDPENNSLLKAKFHSDGLRGLLTRYNLVIV